MTNVEYYHRFENSGSEVRYCQFAVVKKTPAGVWIKYWGKNKFILDNTQKKFAAKTLDEARLSFRKRKEKQLKIMRAKVREIEQAIEQFETDEYYLKYPLICE